MASRRASEASSTDRASQLAPAAAQRIAEFNSFNI